jgi:hypothetical protein
MFSRTSMLLTPAVLVALSATSLILNTHTKHVLITRFSGYRDVANAFVYHTITSTTLGQAKFDYSFRTTKALNAASWFGMALGCATMLKWWRSRGETIRNQGYESLKDKEDDESILSFGETPKRFWRYEQTPLFLVTLFLSTSFLISLHAALWSWSVERDSYKRCQIVSDGQGHQIATCTPEAAVCYMLDTYVVLGRGNLRGLCWEVVSDAFEIMIVQQGLFNPQSLARYFVTGALICEFVLVGVHSINVWRKWKAVPTFSDERTA